VLLKLAVDLWASIGQGPLYSTQTTKLERQ